MKSNNLIFLEQYNELINRTKKKIFQKPKFIEISTELLQMGNNLSNFHQSAEISHYLIRKHIDLEKPNLRIKNMVQLESARIMLQKEIEEYRFGLQFTGDNYTIAMKTYYEIVDELKNTELRIYAVNILCELANISIQLDQLADAISHLNVAINIKDNLKDYYYFYICYKMVECSILIGNYYNSHEIIQELILNDINWKLLQNSTFNYKFICQVSITNILILLLLFPKESDCNNQKIKSKNILDDFVNSSFNSEFIKLMCLSLELFYSLKSLIYHFQNGNAFQLQFIEKQLTPLFSDFNSLILYEIMKKNFDCDLFNSFL